MCTAAIGPRAERHNFEITGAPAEPLEEPRSRGSSIVLFALRRHRLNGIDGHYPFNRFDRRRLMFLSRAVYSLQMGSAFGNLAMGMMTEFFVDS